MVDLKIFEAGEEWLVHPTFFEEVQFDPSAEEVAKGWGKMLHRHIVKFIPYFQLIVIDVTDESGQSLKILKLQWLYPCFIDYWFNMV